MRRVLTISAIASTFAAGAVHAQDLIFTPGDGAFDWESYEAFAEAHDFSGETLDIFGPWRGAEQEQVQNVVAYFAAATGATANYSSSEGFEQQLVIDLEAGSPPDIGILPQPGLIADLVSRGFVAPLGDETAAWVEENYAAGSSWSALGAFTGPDGEDALYAFPYKADVKSLVWYSPDNFFDFGYEIPETQAELDALEEQMIADGETPWCVGLGSGGATGWPATDWMEDLMLRSYPPEVYDGWVSNEIPFDDPRVIDVMEQFGEIVLNDEMVAGGADAVAATDFRESPLGLFASPPQCFMHKQASFIPSFFPDGTELGLDVDFFYFPPDADAGLGNPVLGAGSLAFITDDSPAARAFIDFLKLPIAHEVWMAQSGFLTAHRGVDTSLYSDETLKKMGDVLLNATTFRFDASDLMPSGIGAGTFWTGMVDYVGGAPAAEVAADIQQSWEAQQ